MDKVYITDNNDNMIVVKIWDGVEVCYCYIAVTDLTMLLLYSL